MINEKSIVFVDVDETFVRSVGSKRIPIPNVIRAIRLMSERGALLYCWSSGGAQYAQESAREFGIERCFFAFLPKPNVILDDQPVSEWRYLEYIHPVQCDEKIDGND